MKIDQFQKQHREDFSDNLSFWDGDSFFYGKDGGLTFSHRVVSSMSAKIYRKNDIKRNGDAWLEIMNQ